MRRVRIIVIVLGIIGLIWNVGAEEAGHHEDGAHHHSQNEIGISFGAVFLQPEDETAAGIHLHYMHRLGDHGWTKYFGVGFGFESIFADHPHHNIMGTIGFFPCEHCVFTASPGVAFAKEEGETHRHFSLHFELAYEIEVGTWAMGPAIGYSLAGKDTHITLGIHFGKGF